MKSIRNRKPIVVHLVAALVAASSFLPAAHARKPAENGGPVLTLEEYLSQVRSRHDGIRASGNAAEGARERSREGELLLAPSLIANVQYLNDNSPTQSGFSPTGTQGMNYQLGISKLTDFGMTAKAVYNLGYASLSGVPAAYVSLLPAGAEYYTGKFQIDITQSLWRNWGGSETKATLQAVESAALMTSHNEAFKIKMALAEAESVYWRLSLARETVAVTRETLARSEKIRDWNRKRAELNLTDNADAVQAEAAVKLRQLELESALDEERAAAHAFNTLRGIDSTEVREPIVEVDFTTEASTRPPERAEHREDVLAAREQARLAEANAKAGQEKNKPTLSAFASLGLNGRDQALGTTLGNSFGTNNTYFAAGLSFTAPLNFGLLGDTRGGYLREQIAAEQNYTRRLFEEDRQWLDLTSQLEEGKRRLKLARQIEEVQKNKLDLERDRHRRGRTTTYQVLLFEQDYASAQLSRIRSEAELLRILAQMRTFSPASSNVNDSSQTRSTTSASKGGASS